MAKFWCRPTSVLQHLLLFNALYVFSIVNAHAGISSPPPMLIQQAFLQNCGKQAAGILIRAPTISQEIWKRVANRPCAQRICQGAFVQDQDLSTVPKFLFGQNIPVTIRVQVPHGGNAQIFLMDVVGQKTLGKLLDLGFFGTRKQPAVQTFNVQVPQSATGGVDCGTVGNCALGFLWQVSARETYQSCSLITLR